MSQTALAAALLIAPLAAGVCVFLLLVAGAVALFTRDEQKIARLAVDACLTIAAGAALCADLKTLALPVDSLATTGTDATPWLVVALALLILGAALVIVQRRIARRRQLPHRSH